jgi:DNA-directed RNA polymerase specialized sigma24 family protein
MADQHHASSARGDEADLFRAHNDELMRILTGSLVNCPPEIVEDACAFAWAQLIDHQPDRGRNWRGWLFRTAQREAWKLQREAREHRPLRTSEDQLRIEYSDPVDPRDYQQIHTDVGDALSIIKRLPPRLQRIAMLRALGLRHAEIGEVTGDSATRVVQLVARANLEIGEMLGERAFHELNSSPRAERLWQLEHEQPAWLVEKLGRMPPATRRKVCQNELRRAWRRAAPALDDRRAACTSSTPRC